MKNSKPISVMDSVAYAEKSNSGHIIICGSHGGESAAKYLLNFSPAGAIFNDAGQGKNSAGVSGLHLLSDAGIPAAAVDTFTAEIGDGNETYNAGIISTVNNVARKCGVGIGMTAIEAAKLMLNCIKKG
ncbi:MAG: hypothetical protein L3J28_13240 [Candidatus Polarisedimenticolaceae bacterium]|nr:hypothetical protein [Candidatus Polarisedimenticolaceae bacterium]